MNEGDTVQHKIVVREDWVGIFKKGCKNRYTFDGGIDEDFTGSKLSELLNRSRKEQFNNKDFSGGFTFDELVLTLDFIRRETPLPLTVEMWLAKEKVKETKI